MFESDLIICLGSHLSIHPLHYTKIMLQDQKDNINIDKDQLENLNVKFDLKICADIKQFIYKIRNKKLFNKSNCN